MVVREESRPEIDGRTWLLKCDCGNTHIARTGHLNAGYVQSCGCLQWRHGHGRNGKHSREYTSYHNMIARCHRPSNKRYSDYGGRGIFVCNWWREDYLNFLSDMGPCPDGYQIDRIDNDVGYNPDNCRWVSAKENMSHRRNTKYLEYDGERLTISEWAERYGLEYCTLSTRIRRGKRPPHCFRPVRKTRKVIHP